MRISDWSSDVCSSDLPTVRSQPSRLAAPVERQHQLHHPRLRQWREQCRDRTVGRRLHRRRLSLALGRPDRRPSERRAYRSAARSAVDAVRQERSEEHTSELQSLMRISYAVCCLKKKTNQIKEIETTT